MTTSFDEYQKLLKKKLEEIYTETVIDHAINPRNAGQISGADGFGSITGPCGDTMEIYLKITDGKIRDASFWTDGCITTIACGSIATEMIKGKNISMAMNINQNKILDSLGGLPEDSQHCALLASNTIKTAIQDYTTLKNEP